MAKTADTDAPLRERYVATMVLAGVGDAVGFRNGSWEFLNSGPVIHQQLELLGGVNNLNIKLPDWRVSDDTVMHLATAEALINKSGGDCDYEELYSEIARKYIESMKDMSGRSPGESSSSCIYLKPDQPKGYQKAFIRRSIGCGAAMRAMCIGLRYPRPADLTRLIHVSVESGRMTHSHPTGYLGALATALFTAYAIQGKPMKAWGQGLMTVLDEAKEYIKSTNRDVKENLEAWDYFVTSWKDYLDKRNLTSGQTDPVFPEAYGVEERDKFYTSVSLDGWGGATGHDAPMIAYDALLGARDNWTELCHRGMFHSGDSDSTGTMAGAWFGALYGFYHVPTNNYENLEYGDRLTRCGVELLRLSHPDVAV